ncbi:hypothetical protein CTAYLR_003585 [Chrysophaeum taylorii]|uniref:C3H1-type domain-containing protein n=1 Tax=Chrysophaeum taylorii TaxID=2483200 RepID=A0AAD7UM98_9STRA|nr:hypothetical protein CTAYLR_003585 [Chrysophaeum taylorii]
MNGAREQADIKLCKNFLLGGDAQQGSSHGCKFGSKCNFAHVLQRVADVVPPQQTGGNLAALSSGSGQLPAVKAVASTIDAQGNPQIFTGSVDGVVRQWNLEKWTADQPIRLLGEIGCVAAVHPFLVCGYEGVTTIPGVPVGLARVWNVEGGPEIDLGTPSENKAPGPPMAHRRRVACAALRPRPAENILEIYTGGLEGDIHFWQLHVQTGHVRLGHRLEGHVRGVAALRLFPPNEATSLLSGSSDRTVRWWNLDDPNKTCRGALTANENGHSDEVTAIAAFALDGAGAYFATGGKDSSLKIWDANGVLQLSHATHAPVLALDTAPNAAPNNSPVVVVGLDDGSIELRQPHPNFMLRAALSTTYSPAGHRGPVHTLICSANFFCSGAADGHLMVWQWKHPFPPPQPK